jgi:hypothetical protein
MKFQQIVFKKVFYSLCCMQIWLWISKGRHPFAPAQAQTGPAHKPNQRPLSSLRSDCSEPPRGSGVAEATSSIRNRAKRRKRLKMRLARWYQNATCVISFLHSHPFSFSILTPLFLVGSISFLSFPFFPDCKRSVVHNKTLIQRRNYHWNQRPAFRFAHLLRESANFGLCASQEKTEHPYNAATTSCVLCASRNSSS